MTENDLTQTANQARELFIAALVGEGYLTKDQGREIMSEFVVVIRKKGWWGKLFDKFRGITNDGMYVEIVKAAKIASIDDMDEDE